MARDILRPTQREKQARERQKGRPQEETEFLLTGEPMRETTRTKTISENLRAAGITGAEINRLKGSQPPAPKKKKRSSLARLAKMIVMGKRYKGPW